jgi:hypothetical protein
MPLKIVSAAEPLPVETLCVTIYAEPGVGKTTLGFTANNPLLLDFDQGARRAANRKDSVQVDGWPDVAGLDADTLAPYSTIVVDTVGRALDVLAIDIMRRNPKMGNNGALSLQGFGQLKSQFAAWVKLLRSFGKDVVFIAHANEERNGDDVAVRLDAQGASKNEIYKQSDAMGRISVDAQGTRILNFTPGLVAYGKNPAQLDPIPVQDVSRNPNTLAEVIAQIKEAMNELTDAQRERMKAIDEWRETVGKAENADHVNTLIDDATELPENIRMACKSVLADRAKALGLSYSKSAGGYIALSSDGESQS